MTQARPIVRPNSRIWLLPAFLLIIAGFALGNLVVFVSTRKIQERDRTIAKNAFVSIEAVSRLVHDIDEERLLVDAHIFETATPERDRIEKRLSAVQMDMAITAGTYEPLTTFPGEHAIWEDLWKQVNELQGPIQDVISLSRRDQDAEAKAAMGVIEKNFETINENAEKLVDVNHRMANNAVDEIRNLQRKSQVTFGGITLGGIALASFLGWWVTRIVTRQDNQIERGALLLEERNRELDAFAGRVAHDLRGPLNAINLATFSLSKYLTGERETLDVLQRSVARMDSLIQDLLALSRIETDMTRTVALTDAVVVSLQEELAPKVRNVDGSIRIDLQPSTVRGSETLFRQVLLNLGENAVKYRRKDVHLQIDISGRKVDSWYELQVSDNGTGISPKEAAHIFEPFFRAEKVRCIPGTGLGLSIVKRVVDAFGGRISVASEIERGTTFTVRLPVAPTEQRRAV